MQIIIFGKLAMVGVKGEFNVNFHAILSKYCCFTCFTPKILKNIENLLKIAKNLKSNPD